jgi:tRNA threonylcarbamoyladenosine biosynthesis protein TsaE
MTYTLKDIPNIASKIIEQSKYKTVLFYGEMGSGKTTLIKEVIKQLGVNENVNSPTFSLVNEYVYGNNEFIYHFDFYRVKDEEEALNIGIEDYFYKKYWCFIEWPQNVENLLPLDTVSIYIKIIDEQTRFLTINN